MHLPYKAAELLEVMTTLMTWCCPLGTGAGPLWYYDAVGTPRMLKGENGALGAMTRSGISTEFGTYIR